MFIRAKYVLQFSRRDDLRNTGFDPAIEIVELFGPVFFFFEDAERKAEGSISYNYRFHIVTRFKP